MAEQLKIELQPFIPLFKKEVTKRARAIDPSDEHQWHSLTVGWAIAKGMTPADAYYFATFIRYHTDLA
jgi:hypothetical protein